MITRKEISDRFSRRTLLLSKRLLNWRVHCGEVLFVAGMQRSGTNMVMDTLERSLATDVYHEWDKRAFIDYQMKDRAVIRGLLEQSHGRVFTIKALCELQDLTELMAEFNPSKTLWIFRNYWDVVNSMIHSFVNMDKQIIRLADDPNSEAWLGKGMSEQTHSRLKDMVKPDISLASAAALQWYIRNVLFFEQGFENDLKVLPIIYEQLASSPERELRRILDFSGIDYSKRIVGDIHAGSVGRRKPMVLDEDIAALCSSLEKKITRLSL